MDAAAQPWRGLAAADGHSACAPPTLEDASDICQPGQASEQSPAARVKLLAAAHAPLPDKVPTTPLDDDGPRRGRGRPFFSSAQWTADGTTIIVGSSDNAVSSFVLPADLLESAHGGLALEPQATTKLPEPTQAIAAAPFFSLAEPAAQTYLVGCRDHPLQLYHAFPHDARPSPLATYRLIRKETEEHIAPASLLWQQPGTHFLCGSANRLDYFDLSRHGSDGPVLTLPTIPSRRHISKGSGVGFKGTVAALAASPYDADGASIVAAGTRTRWMGLYDLHRTDKVVSNWSLPRAVGSDLGLDFEGQGIVQLVWSPCGRYLLVNERHSGGLLVYDIRGTASLLGVLGGRISTTQQRLTCDVYQGDPYGDTGFEVWAGSQDGSILVWEGVGMHYGLAQPSWAWTAHESPVGSTVLHRCGSVVATCSGAWEHTSDLALDEMGPNPRSCAGSRTLDESSLKVWSIGAQG